MCAVKSSFVFKVLNPVSIPFTWPGELNADFRLDSWTCVVPVASQIYMWILVSGATTAGTDFRLDSWTCVVPILSLVKDITCDRFFSIGSVSVATCGQFINTFGLTSQIPLESWFFRVWSLGSLSFECLLLTHDTVHVHIHNQHAHSHFMWRVLKGSGASLPQSLDCLQFTFFYICDRASSTSRRASCPAPMQ
jgi:hypothetical protein